MSAELFLSRMAAPYRDGPTEAIDPAEAERIGHQRIDAYDFDPWHPGDLQALALLLGVEHGDPDLEATSGPNTVAAFRRRLEHALRDALRNTLAAVLWPRPDVQTLTFGDHSYLLTGTMSNDGDLPEAYDWITALDWIGVYDEPIP